MANIDYTQVQDVSGIEATDTDGNIFSVEDVIVVPLIITRTEASELLAEYDSDSGTSPKVSEARPLARVILDALKKHIEEGG